MAVFNGMRYRSQRSSLLLKKKKTVEMKHKRPHDFDFCEVYVIHLNHKWIKI